MSQRSLHTALLRNVISICGGTLSNFHTHTHNGDDTFPTNNDKIHETSNLIKSILAKKNVYATIFMSNSIGGSTYCTG